MGNRVLEPVAFSGSKSSVSDDVGEGGKRGLTIPPERLTPAGQAESLKPNTPKCPACPIPRQNRADETSGAGEGIPAMRQTVHIKATFRPD